jgi:type II secretory pathway pseudopilin PulG
MPQPHHLRWRSVYHDVAGVALIEAIVASTVLAVGVVGLLQLVSVSAQAARDAAATTDAASLAAQKLEELRSLAFGIGVDGRFVTDTVSDTTTTPERPVGGTGLTPSPPMALSRDTPGYVDHVDQYGVKVADAAHAAFTRRWSIVPLPAFPEQALVIQVFATRRPPRGVAVESGVRRPGEALVLTIRRRGHA